MDLRKEIAKALDGPELFKKAKGIEDRRAAKLVSIDVDITRQDEAKALFACPCHPMEDSKGLILHFDDQSIEELTVDVLANLLQAPLSAVFLEALAGLKQGGQA